jgi:hypothetical protein
MRRKLRGDRINPWRYHSWQKSTDPQFIDKAGPVLELYEQAQALSRQAEAVCCIDEKTPIQVRQRVSATIGAIPQYPLQVADRYRRMGAINLFCAVLVATGITFAQCFPKRCFADFKTFMLALFASTASQGLHVLQLVLDSGSTHAPKQLVSWIELHAGSACGLGTCWTIFHLYCEEEAANLHGIPYGEVRQVALIPVAHAQGTAFGQGYANW